MQQKEAITENIIAMKATKYNCWWNAERRTKYLLKKPAKGGIPAMEKRPKVKVSAKTGFNLESPPN